MPPTLFDANKNPMADTIDDDFISFLPFSEPQAVGVAMGMINGEIKTGTMSFFDPSANELALRPDRKTSGSTTAAPVRIATDQVAYIAYLAATPPPPPQSLRQMEELEVQVMGNKKFRVRAVKETVASPLGFFAWPADNRSLFREFYFFSHGLAQTEDQTLFGEMLTRDGRLSPSQVEAGLKQQFVEHNTPVGEILVEQQITEPELIEQVAAHQSDLMKTRKQPIRIGDILVASGLATEQDIQRALQEQKKRKGKRLGQILVEMGIAKEEDVSSTLAEKFHLPFIDLNEIEPQIQALSEVPIELIERYRVFPYKADRDTLWIAIGDPLQLEAIEVIRFRLKKKVKEVVVMQSQLDQYLSKYFPNMDDDDTAAMSMDDIISHLSTSGEQRTSTSAASDLVEVNVNDPVVNQLVNRIIIDGVRRDASDIHIEPYGENNDAVVRFRVDGVCSTYQTIPATYSRQVISRIKIMSKLDIAERRKPQDGKIRFKAGKTTIELRVATIPTVGGNEDVVMRILAGGGPLPLDKMGFSEQNREQLEKLVERPYGILLAVGPTGSGKTTTLHSLVGHINDDQRKIWTAEDPVEITQEGLRQVQVQPQIGFNFAAAIRSFLRADPDVILVGEMRDHETASIGVEASLTGHLVLSTLHTNSASETVTRLIDMGIDPFTFADSLLGVLAQRLARRLCSKCKEQYEASDEERAEIEQYMSVEEVEELTEDGTLKLWRSCGCDECNNSGLKGRIGIHELLVSSDEIKRAVQNKANASEVLDIAKKDGMKTLVQDGIKKAIEGHTTIKQVLSVCSR